MFLGFTTPFFRGGTMVGAVLAHVLILGPSSMPAIILGLLSASVVWLHKEQFTMLKAKLIRPAA
jgi:hypothetical protein